MSAWGFTGAADARSYLRDVLRLWTGWVLGLAALLLTEGWWVVVAGVVTIGLLLVLARPLQARAAALVPEDTLAGGRFNVVGRGTKRDRALQAYAYGRAPLEEAIGLGDTGRWMLAARPLLIWGTVAAFIYVIVVGLGDPTTS